MGVLACAACPAAVEAFGLAGFDDVDGLVAESVADVFGGAGFVAAVEELAVAVARDGLPIVLVEAFALADGLEDDAAADAPASYGCDEPYEVGDFADVGEFVEHAVPVAVEHAVGFGVGFAYECFEEALAEDAGDEGECGAGVGQFEVDDPFALVEGFEPDVVAVEDDLVEGGAATSCSSAVCSDTSTSPPPCVTSDSCRTRCATPWNPPHAPT